MEMASVDENAPEPEINYEMDDVVCVSTVGSVSCDGKGCSSASTSACALDASVSLDIPLLLVGVQCMERAFLSTSRWFIYGVPLQAGQDVEEGPAEGSTEQSVN